jgi:hypothetical protein
MYSAIDILFHFVYDQLKFNNDHIAQGKQCQ